MVRNIYRKFLKDELWEIFKILDKMTDKDEARKIYGALDRAVYNAVVLGTSDPNPGVHRASPKDGRKGTQGKTDGKCRCPRTTGKDAPLCEGFRTGQRILGPATTYKALMKRPEFVSVIDGADRQSRSIDNPKGRIRKGLNPPQIKGDSKLFLWRSTLRQSLSRRLASMRAMPSVFHLSEWNGYKF